MQTSVGTPTWQQKLCDNLTSYEFVGCIQTSVGTPTWQQCVGYCSCSITTTQYPTHLSRSL